MLNLDKPKLLINPDKEIFKWGPTPATFLNFDCYDGIFKKFPRLNPGYEWPPAIVLFRNKRLVYLSEWEAMQREGQKLFVDRMLPIEEREKYRALCRLFSREFADYQARIVQTDLKTVSNEGLCAMWETFSNYVTDFWVNYTLPELSNYGAVDYLKRHVERFVLPDSLAHVMEILTAPVEVSFYQKEEIDLAESQNIKEHQRKYFWIENSYASTEVVPVEAFAARKREISPTMRSDAMRRLEDVKARKEEVISRYALPGQVVQIAEAIVDGISWQDDRKSQIWIYLHYKDILLREIARRYGASEEALSLYLMGEITQFIRGERGLDDVEDRKKGVGIVGAKDFYSVIDSKTVRSYWDIFLRVTVDAALKEFGGIIACKGNDIVRGAVRIVIDPRAAHSFRQGDILVTTMTAPEYVFLMKKAGAVVTDTGGLMSHAAVVSREFNIPCIVGTKIATTVLKDGDVVEVDAIKGVVRIVNRA